MVPIKMIIFFAFSDRPKYHTINGQISHCIPENDCKLSVISRLFKPSVDHHSMVNHLVLFVALISPKSI